MTPNIHERIRRLLALSESSNVHEAATAAAKAQELMTKHRIDLAELAVEGGEADEPIQEEDLATFVGASRRDPWRGIVARGLAHANGCDVYSVTRMRGGVRVGMVFRIIGPSSAAGTVRYLYGHLVAEVERLAQHEAKLVRARGGATGRAWFNSFRLGAAVMISQRLREASRQTLSAATSSTALARIDASAQRVGRAMIAKGLRQVPPFTYANSAAHVAGQKAGRALTLVGASGSLRSGA